MIELMVVTGIAVVVVAYGLYTHRGVSERAAHRAAVGTQTKVARGVQTLLATGADPLTALGLSLGDVRSGVQYSLAPDATPASFDPSDRSDPVGDPQTVAWAFTPQRLGWAVWLKPGRGVKCRIGVTVSDRSYTCWLSSSPPSGAIALEGPDADTGTTEVQYGKHRQVRTTTTR